MIDNTKLNKKPTIAQIPLTLAVLGSLSFFTRKTIKPANGIKNDKTANHTLAFSPFTMLLSSLITLCEPSLDVKTSLPQLGQNFEFSSILLPHHLQYILTSYIIVK